MLFFSETVSFLMISQTQEKLEGEKIYKKEIISSHSILHSEISCYHMRLFPAGSDEPYIYIIPKSFLLLHYVLQYRSYKEKKKFIKEQD